MMHKILFCVKFNEKNDFNYITNFKYSKKLSRLEVPYLGNCIPSMIHFYLEQNKVES